MDAMPNLYGKVRRLHSLGLIGANILMFNRQSLSPEVLEG